MGITDGRLILGKNAGSGGGVKDSSTAASVVVGFTRIIAGRLMTGGKGGIGRLT